MPPYSKLNRQDLIFPELSYQMVGLAFEVYNELGSGQKEKIYQAAMSRLLTQHNVTFKEQVYHPLIFREENISKNYFDFLIENKIILELKRADFFSPSHFEQVNHYLRISKL